MLVKSGSTSTCIMSVFQTVRAPADCLCVQRGHGQSNSCCPRLVSPEYQLGVPAVLSIGQYCHPVRALKSSSFLCRTCFAATTPRCLQRLFCVIFCCIFEKCAEGRAANGDRVCC